MADVDRQTLVRRASGGDLGAMRALLLDYIRAGDAPTPPSGRLPCPQCNERLTLGDLSTVGRSHDLGSTERSVALGVRAEAVGDEAVAVGYGASAGWGATAIGHGTVAPSYRTAIGALGVVDACAACGCLYAPNALKEALAYLRAPEPAQVPATQAGWPTSLVCSRPGCTATLDLPLGVDYEEVAVRAGWLVDVDLTQRTAVTARCPEHHRMRCTTCAAQASWPNVLWTARHAGSSVGEYCEQHPPPDFGRCNRRITVEGQAYQCRRSRGHDGDHSYTRWPPGYSGDNA